MTEIIKKSKYLIFFLLIVSFISLPEKTLAQIDTGKETATTITLSEFIRFFYLYLSRITLLLSFLMIVLAIYSYMTSSGDPKKIGKAKEYLTNSVIAIAAVALAFTFFEVLNPGILKIN